MTNTDTTFPILRAIISREGLDTAMTVAGIPTAGMPDDTAYGLAMKLNNASQPRFAAFIINATEGNIANGDITEALREAFPSAKIGDRHGPHFASYSRTGKLDKDGCRFKVAKAGAGVSRSTTSEARMKAERDALQAVLNNVMDCKNFNEVKKALAPLTATK